MAIHRLLVLSVCILGFAFQPGLHAADTCCVDEDVAAAFLWYQRYSRDWPPTFPVSMDDPQLAFIGTSHGFRGRGTAVAWRTELSPEDGRGLVALALERDGWQALSGPEATMRAEQRGFVPHKPMVVGNNQQFCRGRDGSLHLVGRASEIGTVVTLSHSENQAGYDCDAMIAQQRVQPGYQRGLMAYLPILALPEPVTLGNGNGLGGGSNGVHASVDVETDMSPQAMVDHFAPQLQAQDWQADTEFGGSATSGNIWHRTVDNLELYCILTVTISGKGLRLRMYVEPL